MNTDVVLPWAIDASEHKCNPELDAQWIIKNHDPSKILQALSIYTNYLGNQSGQHENFVRDACRILLEKDSAYRAIFVEAYKETHDPNMLDSQAKLEIASGMLSIEDLLYHYIFSTEDDKDKFNFIYSYLACLTGDKSYAPPKELNLHVLENKMVRAFRNIMD